MHFKEILEERFTNTTDGGNLVFSGEKREENGT